jgi:beta-galactosidase
VAEEEFHISGEWKADVAWASGPVVLSENQEYLSLNAGDVSLRFSKLTGRMEDYRHSDEQFIAFGPAINLFRPLVDNDFGAGLSRRMHDLSAPRPVLQSLEHRKLPDGRLEITVKQSLLDGEAEVHFSYTIDARGQMEVKCDFSSLSSDRDMLLKLGNHWQLPRSLSTIAWYGRGPWESYEDRQYAAHVGQYESEITAMYYPYIRPQESGNRTEVRMAKIYTSEGKGLEILALDSPLQLTALPYSPMQLYPGRVKGQENSALLEEDDFQHLHIDHRQMGVGGINSWGTLPLEKYRVSMQDYSYRYVVRPLR